MKVTDRIKELQIQNKHEALNFFKDELNKYLYRSERVGSFCQLKGTPAMGLTTSPQYTNQYQYSFLGVTQERTFLFSMKYGATDKKREELIHSEFISARECEWIRIERSTLDKKNRYNIILLMLGFFCIIVGIGLAIALYEFEAGLLGFIPGAVGFIILLSAFQRASKANFQMLSIKISDSIYKFRLLDAEDIDQAENFIKKCHTNAWKKQGTLYNPLSYDTAGQATMQPENSPATIPQPIIQPASGSESEAEPEPASEPTPEPTPEPTLEPTPEPTLEMKSKTMVISTSPFNPSPTPTPSTESKVETSQKTFQPPSITSSALSNQTTRPWIPLSQLDSGATLKPSVSKLIPGTTQIPAPATSPVNDDSNWEGLAKCPQCGYAIQANWATCPYCKAELPQNEKALEDGWK